MKREELFSAFNGIDDSYIEEASPLKAPVSFRRRMKPVLAMAATLAIAIGLTTAALHSGLLDSGSAEAPAAEEAAPALYAEKSAPAETAPEPEPAAESDHTAAESDYAAAEAADYDEMISAKEAQEEYAEEPVFPETVDYEGRTFHAAAPEESDLPENFSRAGSLTADGAFRTAEVLTVPLTVYTAPEEPDCLYLSDGAVFRRYRAG